MNKKYEISWVWLFEKYKFTKAIFYKLMYAYLWVYDLITFLKKKEKALLTPKKTKNILISNLAALGDVIITSSVIPLIKKHFPNARLFFLGSSYTAFFTKNHPLIDKVICFDHLRHNRKKISLLKKIIIHYQTKKSAIKQMRKEAIDLAIDFYFYNPNSIKLLFKAKIPNILGYTTGGYKNLLNLKIDKPFNPFWHMSEYHLHLLNEVLEKKEEIRPLLPNLPFVKEPKYKKLKKYENKHFILIHPGAGHKNRHINFNLAIQILDIIPKDTLVLFIGTGEAEHLNIEKIIKKRSNCVNLANKLHVLDLIYLCGKARMAISTDSAISHIASYFDCPQIVFFKTPNIIHQRLWCLNKPNIKIVSPINKKTR